MRNARVRCKDDHALNFVTQCLLKVKKKLLDQYGKMYPKIRKTELESGIWIKGNKCQERDRERERVSAREFPLLPDKESADRLFSDYDGTSLF